MFVGAIIRMRNRVLLTFSSAVSSSLSRRQLCWVPHVALRGVWLVSYYCGAQYILLL